MNNGSTPRKSNLPEERKLARFLRSSARHETALRDALIGKNSIQAAKIIASEFERRFEGKGRTAKDILRVLIPGGKAVSWVRLDITICELCQRFSMMADLLERQTLAEGWEDMPEVQHRQIDFFDKVRLIIQSLPKRKDYKLHEEAADYSTANEKARAFDTCFLCWRSVPRLKKEKKTPLCYVHDMMSTSKEYRRRKKMRQRMLEIFGELEEDIPTPAKIRQENKLHPRDFFLWQILNLNGYFPALAKYLYGLNLRMESGDDLMRALEHPIPVDKLTNADKSAWEFHFGDFGAYFELNYERMLFAEAWLRAEAKYKHGGRRA